MYLLGAAPPRKYQLVAALVVTIPNTVKLMQRFALITASQGCGPGTQISGSGSGTL